MSTLLTARNTSSDHTQEGTSGGSRSGPPPHVAAAAPPTSSIYRGTSPSPSHHHHRSESSNDEDSDSGRHDTGSSTPQKRRRLSGTFSPLPQRVESTIRAGMSELDSPRLADEVLTVSLLKQGEMVNTKRRRRPSTIKTSHNKGATASTKACSNCSGAEEIANAIVQGLVILHREVSAAFATTEANGQTDELPETKAAGHGLRGSLEFAASQIRNTCLMVQKLRTPAVANPGLPSITEAIPHALHAGTPRWGHAVNEPQDNLRAPSGPDTVRQEIYSLLGPSESRLDQIQSQRNSLPHLLSADAMSEGRQSEQAHSHSVHSPHASKLDSPFPLVHSPVPPSSSSSARMLPSPSSLQHFSSSSMGPPGPFQAGAAGAHASHFQDLQHQISTKTLALQTLQREHDHLLAAFSRSQTRCNALEKKSHVSDHEINSLIEEKAQLQAQVSAQESQLEELQASREVLLKQSSAEGAQWRQMMTMSSQLQIKGADEARRFKNEKEAWDRERHQLQERIQALEKSKGATPNLSPPDTRKSGPPFNTDVLASSPVEELRQEVRNLRSRCAEMERFLQDICGETQHITDAVKAIGRIRERLNKPSSVDGASEAT